MYRNELISPPPLISAEIYKLRQNRIGNRALSVLSGLKSSIVPEGKAYQSFLHF